MIIIEKAGRDELSVSHPYSPEFLEALKKAVDYPTRRWVPEEKVWLIKAAAYEKVDKLLRKHFPKMEFRISDKAVRLVKRRYKERVVLPAPKEPKSWGPYRELYVNDDAPQQVVIAAYKALARMYHPDLGGSTEAMTRVNRAFESIRTMRGW